VSTLALRPLRLPDSASLVGGLLLAALLGVMIVQEPLLGFAAVFGLALAVAVLAWPALATLTVVFLIYTNAAAVAVKYHDVPYTAGIVIPVLLVVPVAFYLYRRRPIVADAPVLAIVVFLVVQVVSTLLANDKGHALGEMTPFLVEGVAIYLLVRNAVRTVDVLRVVVWALLLAGVLMAAVVIFQEITATYSKPYMGFGQVGHDWLTGRSKNPRLSGPIGDPNYFAQILLVLIPLGLLRFFGERTMFLRLLAAAATGLIAFALTLTFSRGAGVAFAVVLVMMTVLRYIRLYQLMTIAVGIVLLLNFVPEYKERVATLGRLTGGSPAASSGADQSVASRATEMKAAVAVFLDHPLVGVGPGSFPLYYQEYARRVGFEVHEAARSGSRRGEEARRESHNMFLSIAADLGILGLASFLAIVFLTFRRLNHARNRWLVAHPEAANLATSFMLALVAYLTSGLFLTLAFERYFWLLVALAGCAATLDLGRTPAPESARDREEAGPVRRPLARRERTAAPLRRPPVRRRPRPVRRPHRAPADVPILELPPPVEAVPPAPPPVEAEPPAPAPVEAEPPAPPPVEAAPPAPVEAVPPAPPVEPEPAVPVEVPAEPAPVEFPFPPPVAPATVVIDVTFEEAETGVTKLVEVPHVTRCAACRGTGADDGFSGPECEGIGRKVAWTTLSVEIPPYVDDGMRIPLPGVDGPSGYALLCVEGDPNDRIIRYVALTELVGALGFLGYLYFLA
jgi:putative inorganic carbon (HCO3(-)) transporter